MWTSGNDTKMLVWMKIFCFIFTAMKTDTLENALEVQHRQPKVNVRVCHPNINSVVLQRFEFVMMVMVKM